jgi:hypothetical protein
MGQDSGLQSPDSVSWPSAYDIFGAAITGFRPRRSTQMEGRGRTGEGREGTGHQLRHERRGGEEAGVGVLDRQRTKGVPEVDECGLAEISNSKEETRGTQFRQVRAARCVIPYVLYAAWLWIDWVRLQDDAI